jgi:hypothetical protein
MTRYSIISSYVFCPLPGTCASPAMGLHLNKPVYQVMIGFNTGSDRHADWWRTSDGSINFFESSYTKIAMDRHKENIHTHIPIPAILGLFIAYRSTLEWSRG